MRAVTAPRVKVDEGPEHRDFVGALADYLEGMSPEEEAGLERALRDDREHGTELSPDERAALAVPARVREPKR